MADVHAAAAVLTATGVGPGTKAGIRAGSVFNGHSYASLVAHLATFHLAASPVQLAERLQLNPGEWRDRAGRTIIVLGGRLPVAVRDTALATVCGTLLVGYGSSETGSIASGDSALIDRHSGAVGFVRDGVTVEIADAR